MDTSTLSPPEVRSVVIAFQLRDLDSVRAACRQRGWEFRAGQRTFRRHGDWPGRCAHAIHIPGFVDEIALRAGAGCHELEFGPALTAQVLQLRRACFLATVARAAVEHGLTLGVPLEVGGQLRLRVTGRTAVAHVCWTDGRITLWTFGDPTGFASLADALGTTLSEPESRT